MTPSQNNQLAYFDTLPGVEIDFLLGKWSGSEILTGHPLDGLLTLAGWRGKHFISPRLVHPLVFQDFNVNPDLIPMLLPLLRWVPRTPRLASLIKVLRPVLETSHTKASLQTLSYRGKETGAMVYDHKNITDYFAKIDENHVLGLMVLKNSPPYFFKLTREQT